MTRKNSYSTKLLNAVIMYLKHYRALRYVLVAVTGLALLVSVAFIIVTIVDGAI